MALFHSPTTVMSDLALYLDAANTRSYPGSGTAWTDLSGSNNTATLTNGPTYSTANNGIITFDGVNDYATTAFSISARPFTINAWIYFNSLSGWQTVVGQDTAQATSVGRFYFQKTNNSGSISPRTNNTFGLALVNSSSVEVYCYDPTTVQVSTWYNYTVSVSTTNITLYKNGVQVNDVSNSDALASATGSTIISAGYFSNSLTDYVNGRVPLVQIYNRALTQSEIQQNFNAHRGRFGV